MRRVAQREVYAEYQAKAAMASMVVNGDARKRFIDQTLSSLLAFTGSEFSLEELRRQNESDMVSQYEDIIQSRYKLSLAQASRTLVQGMLARDESQPKR